MAAAGGVRWLLALGLAWLGPTSRSEFPDLTLVLQPDQELDWGQINRWMGQSRFSEEAGSQRPTLSQASGQPPGSEPTARTAASPAGSTTAVPRGPSSVVPGPALVPGGPAPEVPGPELVPGVSPTVARSRPPPALPTSSPMWRPVRPGAAPLPVAPAPPARWTPQWPELRPGPPLVPQPLVSRQSQPTFPELQRGEPLLPADAPGAQQPQPQPEPEPEADRPPGLRPMPGARGPLPADERQHYQPPAIDDYDQLPPPAQLRLATGPTPTPLTEPEPERRPQPSAQQRRTSSQQRPLAAGADSGSSRPQPAARHAERSVSSQVGQSARPGPPPPSGAGRARPVEPGGGRLSPGTLAVLLQRLEERLMAGEQRQQQHSDLLRDVQHSQRKAEVVAQEDLAATRAELRDLNTKVEHLQSDLSRVSGVLEAVLTAVQDARRTLQERAEPAEPPPAEPPGLAALGRRLGQLVVNTELLKGGQRRLGGAVRAIENRTSELSERSELFATKTSLARGLSEMRTYLDKQTREPAAPASDEGGERLPADCSDVLLSGAAGARSGIYQVRPRRAPQPIFVYCDQETDGGGWAVIQRRTNGDEDFYRDWISYKYGFGNLAGEFWLGNENIHLLTSHRLNSLRVELADFPRQRPGFEDYPGSNATASYAAFALGSELEGYSLKVLDHYSGDAGDSLKYHAGMKFSTKDVDNDLWQEDSCAVNHKGGWWYKGCDSSNLNGLYLSGPVPSEFEYQVVYWYDWRGPLYSLHRTQMMVRPADHQLRAAERWRREPGGAAEEGKTAAQRRLGTQMVRGRSRRRRQRHRRGRRHGH